MKKVLFATTALIATASVAAADVSFGGYGRFGADYNSSRAAGAEIGQTSRFRLNITGTTETDNGLSFSAAIRIEDSETLVGQVNGARFTVAAGGLSVSVGNAAGAIDAQAGAYAQSLGLTGLGYHNVVANSAVKGFWGFDGYSGKGNGREAVTVSYSAGDFGVMASFSDTAGEQRSALNASYSFSGWKVSLGYQDSNNNANDKITMTVGGNVGIADLAFAVADNNGTLKYGIGADFSVGAATTVSAFVNTEDTAGEAYGLGVSHDLGGGASIKGGVVQTAAGTTLADLGLHFNF
ncbi:porin [Planktotalea arctica]|uniref:porin n=1 Tax=Planktotalea arctica TaxID=1481893 RepID=UPI00321B8796